MQPAVDRGRGRGSRLHACLIGGRRPLERGVGLGLRLPLSPPAEAHRPVVGSDLAVATYVELACLVAGRHTTVIVGAAPPGWWAQMAPRLERAISAFVT
jgi:hypothetical protein